MNTKAVLKTKLALPIISLFIMLFSMFAFPAQASAAIKYNSSDWYNVRQQYYDRTEDLALAEFEYYLEWCYDVYFYDENCWDAGLGFQGSMHRWMAAQLAYEEDVLVENPVVRPTYQMYAPNSGEWDC